jgi:hypothetical protein
MKTMQDPTVTSAQLPSAAEVICRIAAEHNLTYQHDGYADLARTIDGAFGDGVEMDPTEQLLVAIGRARIMDGKAITLLHAQYLTERRASQAV